MWLYAFYEIFRNSGATEEILADVSIADDDVDDEALCEKPDIRFKHSVSEEELTVTAIDSYDTVQLLDHLPLIGVLL